MYYELYIDVFFLINFMMDIFILLVAKTILKCPATYGSICIGAVTGSLLTCIALVLPISADCLKFVIFHGLISILITRTGLRIRFHKGFLKAYIVVYISTFLIGGIFSYFEQYMREGSLFAGVALISYALAQSIWKIVDNMRKMDAVLCEVLLINGMKQVKVKAIIDTGNRLTDTVTGKPVSIISRETAKKLWEEIPKEGVRYIPYYTIKGKEGILPLFVLEKMCLYLEEETWIAKASIAVCEEKIGTGEYEMILNPNVR